MKNPRRAKTIYPPKVGDRVSVYGRPARVVKLLGMGTVEAERDGKRYRVSGLPMAPLREYPPFNYSRRRNPAKKKKRARRRRPRGKVVTTVSHSKVIRRTTNRRALVVLYARKARQRLKYLGHGKFGARGRPRLFQSTAEANAVGRALVEAFPTVLRGWQVSAGPEHPPPAAAARQRRFRAGVDPAEALYREKIRQDTEAAHRWLARQKK